MGKRVSPAASGRPVQSRAPPAQLKAGPPLRVPMHALRRRPPSGPAHYLRDLVYGANDGIITTLAVVAGVTGASLSPAVAVVLGLANLAADGISMGASNYLGLKSELDQTGGSVMEEKPARHGLATLVAFIAMGAVPLLAYVLPSPPGFSTFGVALVLGGLALAFVGGARAPLTGRSYVGSALEMLVVGGAAAAAAYAVGLVAERVV